MCESLIRLGYELQGHQSGLGKSIKLLPSDASSQGPGIDFPI